MKDHLDLQGQSGTVYRFRRVPDFDQLPVTSGNVVYVRWRGPDPHVCFVGAVNSLRSANRFWDLAVKSHGAEDLYIRLNVARALRDEEQADLIERIRPPMAPFTDS